MGVTSLLIFSSSNIFAFLLRIIMKIIIHFIRYFF